MNTIPINKGQGPLADKIERKVSTYGIFNPLLKIFKHPALPHRLETVCRVNGVHYINDSAAQSINATYYSLNRIPGPVIWLVCNDDAFTRFEELGPVMVFKTRHIIACGAAFAKLEKLFGSRIPVSAAGSPEEAVRLASQIAPAGSFVLFSPAASRPRYEIQKLSGRFVGAIKKLKNK